MQQILPKNTGKDRKKILFFRVLFFTIRFPGPGKAREPKMKRADDPGRISGMGKEFYTAGTERARKLQLRFIENGPFQEYPVSDKLRREKFCRRERRIFTVMKRLTTLLMILVMTLCSACLPALGEAAETAETAPVIPYRYATAEEGREMMLANTEYFDSITLNKIGFVMHDPEATTEVYKAFAGQQVLEWTDAEKELIDRCMAVVEASFADHGWKMPPLETVVFIRTTMLEEGGAFGYTHGTQIYLSGMLEQYATLAPEQIDEPIAQLLAHELFHCLTRCNPDFRKDMYSIIHFTVDEEEYEFPASVAEYYIANPDVEKHNAHATFLIDGRETECYTAYITTKHCENEAESFMDFGVTALVPTDGSDVWYRADQASNFNEVFGTNTGYVIDPEECMADNFSYAVIFGGKGPEGSGYPNPEIISAIGRYLAGE